jgi:N6-L-threonylcarbamoyladenine synthase/protein kinase Bud32
LTITLGLEGTAHTISASVLDENSIYSLVSRTFKPEKGGINPKDAANFHFNNVTEVITQAVKESGKKFKDLDIVGFSKGPGLPPSLKITAVAARSIALKLRIPIVGVNHPLGHVEIGRRETGANDPIMLYVSGGNTQIIGHKNGKYRVFGETLDIGIGNLLDKIARDMGYPFPGGPEIERLALNGSKLLDLPYSVNGMDCSFSGIYTACIKYLKQGETAENVSYSVQEYAFSMLVETLERALYLSGKSEILLAGGVAKNARLKGMIRIMSEEAHIKVFETPEKYCMDNGAMIGQAALLTYKYIGPQKIEDTAIDQMYRIDQTESPWVKESNILYKNMGAESEIINSKFHQFSTIDKIRIKKSYRVDTLDEQIRSKRMKNELTALYRMFNSGIPVPCVFAMDVPRKSITMEKIQGDQLSNLEVFSNNIIEDLGTLIGNMHGKGFVHGDLTLNNLILSPIGVYIIDPSMCKVTDNPVEMAYDLRLLKESIISLKGQEAFSSFLKIYENVNERCFEAKTLLEELEKRRRYV